MHQQTVCITGGTGFVGQHLSNRLTKQGYKVRILTRRRERYRNLLVNPGISLIEADVHSVDELKRHFQGVDIIINLVGILNENGKKGDGFRRVHLELPEKIVFAAEACGVMRLLQMSALNADTQEPHSLYLKTRGEGEDLVHAAADKGMVVTSFRPSVIFGAEASVERPLDEERAHGPSYGGRAISPPAFGPACPGRLRVPSAAGAL